MNLRSYIPGRILYTFSILLIVTPVFSKQLYNMADLEILKAEKNYREFFAHARDLRPRERTQHWVSMVRSMAVDFIDEQIKYKNYKNQTVKIIEGLAIWPLLKSDEFFQVKRNRYQVKLVRHCLVNQKFDQCYQNAKEFWQRSNREPDTGYQISNLLYSVQPKMDLWPFLSHVVAHPLSSFYCGKKVVVEKMIQHYFLELNEKDDSEKIARKLDLELHENCWKEAVSSLQRFIFNGPEYYRTLVYQMLKSKKSIPRDIEDRYLTLYLLDSPIPGHVFNKAWNNMKSLGENLERRNSVMAFLQKLDPLPGAIFASSNHALRKSVMKLFGENFDEYLTFYAKTCLSYLKGVRSFPNGNPTVQCDDFYANNKKENWVGQSLQMNYSSIKK